MRTRLRILALLVIVFSLFTLAGCGDNGSAPVTPGPTPTPTPVPVAVSINPSSPTISITETVEFTATVTGSTNTAVTWIASAGTVEDGVFTPPMMAGTYTVTATSQADTTKSATADVTVTAPAPVITNTPPPIASVGNEYTYAPTATAEPEGATVTFTLTQGPANATLSKGTIAWTPEEDQGRATQHFVITATSSVGGVATFPWDVNTFGVVRGTYVDKYWHVAPVETPTPEATPTPDAILAEVAPPPETPLTSTDVPRDMTEWSVWAIFRYQTEDGIQLGVSQGEGFEDGTFEVPAVPAGEFWLGLGYYGEFEWYRTDGTTGFDYGSDYYGRPDDDNWMPTTFGFNLFGIAQTSNCRVRLEVVSPNAGSAYETRYNQDPNCGESSVNFENFAYLRPIDPSQGDAAFVLQRDRVEELSQMAENVKVDAVTTALALDWVTTNPEGYTFIQGLMSAPASAFNVNVKASEWSQILLTAAPGVLELRPWKASLSVLPFVTDIYAYPQAGYDRRKDLADAYATDDTDKGAPSSSLELATIVSKGNAVDQDLGTFRYVNPFPPSWKVMFGAQQKAVVPVLVPGSEYPTDFRVDSAFLTDNIPDGPIAPVMSGVRNPKINGEDFFSIHLLELSEETPDVTITWEPPAESPSGIAPFGYQVAVHVLRSDMGYPDHQKMWSFYTSDTSVVINGNVLGMLMNAFGGSAVAFKIRAMADGRADMRTAPWRSELPIADTSIVSGPVLLGMPVSVESTRQQLKGLMKDAAKTLDAAADPKKAATAARIKARRARSLVQDDEPQPTK